MAAANVIYTDPVTGVYETNDGNYWLKNGTQINTYDPKTGAYQELDTTWYTCQGVPLLAYNIQNGWYQESDDGSWYTSAGVPLNTDANGNPIAPAAGAQPVAGKGLPKTAPAQSNTMTMYVVVFGIILATIIAATMYLKKGKK